MDSFALGHASSSVPALGAALASTFTLSYLDPCPASEAALKCYLLHPSPSEPRELSPGIHKALVPLWGQAHTPALY